MHRLSLTRPVAGLRFAALLILAVFAGSAEAQISLGTAVDLALRNSPRIKSSEAEVAKAHAVYQESKDIFVPAVSGGAGLGQAYGYSPYPPTLFTLTAGSLIFNASQPAYIHSARAGEDAARQALADMRETVAEDAALTFVALLHDQDRMEALTQEAGYAAKLEQIVQERLDAGTDSRMDLLNAQLQSANLHVATLRTEEDLRNDRAHLARLLGIPPDNLHAEGGFPAAPVSEGTLASSSGYANASVASAYANARAKMLQASGDTRFLYRPVIQLAAQFNRYATFTNAWTNIQNEYRNNNCTSGQTCKAFGADEYVFGVQINLPLLDRYRRQKGLETVAEASKALHDAEFAQMSVLDAQGKLSHSLELLEAQSHVAELEQQRAALQLEVVRTQMANVNSAPQPVTPKEEQNSLINEREKFLVVVDTAFQLHQAQISLLRQYGRLQEWLAHAALSGPPALPSTPQPQAMPPHP